MLDVWGSIKQRSKMNKDGLHELRLKAVSVIIRPRMETMRTPFVGARAQSSESGGVSWFRSPAAGDVPGRASVPNDATRSFEVEQGLVRLHLRPLMIRQRDKGNGEKGM